MVARLSTPDDDMTIAARFAGDVEAAFSRGETDVEFAVLAKDFEVIPAEEMPGPRSYHGRDGYMEFMSTWVEDFETWSLEPVRVVDAGEGRIVSTLRQSAVGKASGAPVDLEFSSILDVEDGRVVRMQLFMDPAEAFRVAGIWP